MRLKTFFAPSMSEVMCQVRKELGDDALIISTVEEEKGVRVTAAFDQGAGHFSSNVTKVIGKEDNLENILSQLSHCLKYHGLKENLVEEYLKKAIPKNPETLLKNLFCLFESLFSYEFLPLDKPIQDGNRCIMVVGTTGAGKSVTLAKIASEMVMARKPLVIATLDTHKAGAVEQLEAYAKIMEIPLAPLHNAKELQLFMEEIPKDTFVLVDTPGVNPFLREDIHLISQCVLATRHPPYWVLPSGCDAEEVMAMAEVFKDLGVTQVIQTKCDVAKRFGALLAVLSHAQLRLCAFSRGPAVGNRLIPAMAKTFYDLLGIDSLLDSFHSLHHPPLSKETNSLQDLKWIRQIRGASI